MMATMMAVVTAMIFNITMLPVLARFREVQNYGQTSGKLLDPSYTLAFLD